MTEPGNPNPAPVVPAGWHVNPSTGQREWWDGTAWTAPPPKPAGKFGPLALTALIVGGVAFLFGLLPYVGALVAVAAIVLAIVALVKKQTPKWMPLVGGAAGVIALISSLIITSVVAGGIRTPIAVPTTAPTVQAGVEETTTPVETQTPEPVEPEFTLGQQQAVSKAQSYLAYTSFSRSGLIDQLEFEGFETADATFAVDYLEVDWNAQAAAKAEAYLEMSSFSKQSLTEQLEFEGFTPEQAAFGVQAVGY